MVQTLTDLAIRSLSEGVLYDRGRIPGFGIRAGKTRKTWFLITGKNKTKVTLGHYPAVGLAEARKLALAAMAADDPLPKTPAFAVALNEFYEKHVPTLRPLSAYQIKRILNRHFTWTKTLDRITNRDIVEALDAIERPSERAHALKDIRNFFNWCVPRYLKSSPCAGIKKPAQRSRDRVLTADELPKVWKRAKEIGYPYGTIVQILILCGTRAGETAALRWEWIGDDAITIPASVTKNGCTHVLPIGPLTKQVLDTVPRVGSLLFPARGYEDKPFTGFGVMKISLDKCGIKNFTHHDLRRTFATTMAALKVPQEVTERLLNHISGKVSDVAAVYNRYAYMDEMRDAMTHYERWLSGLIS